jgi:hypothetical protein
MPSRKILRTPRHSPRALLAMQRAGMRYNRRRKKTPTMLSFLRRRLNTVTS